MVDLRCVCVSAFALLKTFPDFTETITWSIIFSAEGRQWDLMLHSLLLWSVTAGNCVCGIYWWMSYTELWGFDLLMLLLINCLLLKKIIALWIFIVGILKNTQTFEKDPHILLSDKRVYGELGWKVRLKLYHIWIFVVFFFFFSEASFALCWNLSCWTLKWKCSGLNGPCV